MWFIFEWESGEVSLSAGQNTTQGVEEMKMERKNTVICHKGSFQYGHNPISTKPITLLLCRR